MAYDWSIKGPYVNVDEGICFPSNELKLATIFGFSGNIQIAGAAIIVNFHTIISQF